jgi:hypothetical protein
MELLGWIITGGVAGGVIKIIEMVTKWCLDRRAKKQDQKEDQEIATEHSINVLKDALKVIMLDRILYLGRAYIRAAKVDADDRRRLAAMHKVYHDLGGNGDADLIMAGVNSLQLK